MIDRESLVQMAANRQVRTGDEVWFQDRWQGVGALPELQGRLGNDPWDAWEAEDPAPEPEPEEIQPEPIPDAPRRMVIRTPARPDGPPDAAQATAEPPADEPEEVDHALGQVIAFPAPKPRRELPAMPPNTPRSAPPLVRASRVAVFLLLGIAALAVAWLWVIATGSTAGVRREQVRPPATSTATPLHPTPGQDPARELLQGLRARLPQEVKSVRQPADLGDAILVELQNLETGVTSVDAVVTRWGGPKNDQPKEATVQATFRDLESSDRDVATFGLVVGRYIRAYGLRVTNASVVFQDPAGDRGMTLDGDACADLYNGRLALSKFIQGK